MFYLFLFLLLVIFLVFLDLGISGRNQHAMKLGESLRWSCFWVALALLFNVAVYFIYEYGSLENSFFLEPKSGSEAALQFFTGYLLEKSLSLDNIFVISLIFVHHHIPLRSQHKVLVTGILTAALLRGLLIFFGISLVHRFSFVLYFFGAFLVISGYRLLIAREKKEILEDSLSTKIALFFLPLTKELHGDAFFVKVGSFWKMTPLFLALLQIEVADLIFAIDSIPAIFTITLDPFIVYTSNIFAIFGLRALYFSLAPLIDRFSLMKSALAMLLIFVGVKMLIADIYHISNIASLLIIVAILGGGIFFSAKKDQPLPQNQDLTQSSKDTKRKEKKRN